MKLYVKTIKGLAPISIVISQYGSLGSWHLDVAGCTIKQGKKKYIEKIFKEIQNGKRTLSKRFIRFAEANLEKLRKSQLPLLNSYFSDNSLFSYYQSQGYHIKQLFENIDIYELL